VEDLDTQLKDEEASAYDGSPDPLAEVPNQATLPAQPVGAEPSPLQSPVKTEQGTPVPMEVAVPEVPPQEVEASPAAAVPEGPSTAEILEEYRREREWVPPPTLEGWVALHVGSAFHGVAVGCLPPSLGWLSSWASGELD
jgi:hypothetical protein